MTNLRHLNLVCVDVIGEFCASIGHLTLLNTLILSDVVHVEFEEDKMDVLQDDLKKLTLLKNLKHLEIQDMEVEQRGFFEWIGEETMSKTPFNSLESLCLVYSGFGDISLDFNKYTDLRNLHLEEIVFETIPDPVMELPNLEYLGLVKCALQKFPTKRYYLLDLIKII